MGNTVIRPPSLLSYESREAGLGRRPGVEALSGAISIVTAVVPV